MSLDRTAVKKPRWMLAQPPPAHERKEKQITNLARSLNKVRILARENTPPMLQPLEPQHLPALMKQSLVKENYTPLRVVNVNLVAAKDDLNRCKVLEINDLYSKISAHLTEPVTKLPNMPKTRSAYSRFGFDDMRKTLTLNNFLCPVPECIDPPKGFKFTADEITSIKKAGVPDLSKLKESGMFSRQSTRNTRQRSELLELGRWYIEKVSTILDNPQDNVFANTLSWGLSKM